MGRSAKWVLRQATDDERRNWTKLITQHEVSSSFLQLEQFAEIKSNSGWKARYLIFESKTKKIACLVLEKKIFPIGLLWYVPKGPVSTTASEVGMFAEATKHYINDQKLSVFIVKIEPAISPFSIEKYDLVRSDPVQPITSTIILKTEKTSKQQMALLGKRARRYIRKAEREGIVVKQKALTSETMHHMYALMQTAYGGKGMPGLRSYDYYEAFWTSYAEAKVGRLFFAYEDSRPVVGVYLVTTGKSAVYKDGGSVPDRQSKGAAYLIHWHILSVLAEEGVDYYDLWGAPSSKNVDDETDPLYGIGELCYTRSYCVLPAFGKAILKDNIAKSNGELTIQIPHPFIPSAMNPSARR
jgi:lipid II:glycine glycyltransferase (peptidoglycan interpeptide bridge formation enzyme)